MQYSVKVDIINYAVICFGGIGMDGISRSCFGLFG